MLLADNLLPRPVPSRPVPSRARRTTHHISPSRPVVPLAVAVSKRKKGVFGSSVRSVSSSFSLSWREKSAAHRINANRINPPTRVPSRQYPGG